MDTICYLLRSQRILSDLIYIIKFKNTFEEHLKELVKTSRADARVKLN